MKISSIGRFEGRLFVAEGRLCMVVEADELTGTGRVSCQLDGRQQVVEMSLTEIGRRISSGESLTLDNVNGAEVTNRILKKPDGWFFSTREGLKGPYRSDTEAEQQLNQHIVATQSA
jgi:hypothetical protein